MERSSSNIAIGYRAMQDSGWHSGGNLAIGYKALYVNTTGSSSGPFGKPVKKRRLVDFLRRFLRLPKDFL